MNECCRCGLKPTVGIDFIRSWNYMDGYVYDKLGEPVYKYLHHFCDIHFIDSYNRFYKLTTTVEWSISYSFSDNEEVRAIVSTELTCDNSSRFTDGNSMVRTDGRIRTSDIRNAWAVPTASNTKSWKKGGKARR